VTSWLIDDQPPVDRKDGTMIAGIGRRREGGRGAGADAGAGQTLVEFAIVSAAFFMIVFGTVDFGRAIFLYSELHNAVRDVAREGKVGAANGQGVNTAKLKSHIANYWSPETQKTQPRPGLKNASATVTCVGGCTSGNTLVVEASVPFQAVTQNFLGLSPITLKARASVTLE
jgi:Flp pilus assembly protein TadG